MVLLTNEFNGYTFIRDMLTSPVIDSSFQLALGKIQELALGLAVIFYLLSLAYNYAKNSIASLQNNGGKFFDLSELIRTIVIFIIILNYGIIANGIDSTINIINTGTAISQTDMESFAQKVADINTNRADSPEKIKKAALNNLTPEDTKIADKVNVLKSDDGVQQNDEKVGESATNDVSWYEYLNPAYWWTISIDAMSVFLVTVIKVIISIFALLVFKVLLIFGSVAFAFSIIPAFRGQIDNWFGTVLTTGFVFTTMNILDHLLFHVLEDHLVNPSGIDYSSAQIFNFVMIILYLSSFWLTSKYIGKGDAGRVLSKGVTMATAAVSLGAGAAAAAGGSAAGGGGAATGSSGGMSNVTSAGKDAFKDDDK